MVGIQGIGIPPHDSQNENDTSIEQSSFSRVVELRTRSGVGISPDADSFTKRSIVAGDTVSIRY